MKDDRHGWSPAADQLAHAAEFVVRGLLDHHDLGVERGVGGRLEEAAVFAPGGGLARGGLQLDVHRHHSDLPRQSGECFGQGAVGLEVGDQALAGKFVAQGREELGVEQRLPARQAHALAREGGESFDDLDRLRERERIGHPAEPTLPRRQLHRAILAGVERLRRVAVATTAVAPAESDEDLARPDQQPFALDAGENLEDRRPQFTHRPPPYGGASGARRGG